MPRSYTMSEKAKAARAVNAERAREVRAERGTVENAVVTLEREARHERAKSRLLSRPDLIARIGALYASVTEDS